MSGGLKTNFEMVILFCLSGLVHAPKYSLRWSFRPTKVVFLSGGPFVLWLFCPVDLMSMFRQKTSFRARMCLSGVPNT